MTLEEAYRFARKVMSATDIDIIVLSNGCQRPEQYVAGTPVLLVENLFESGPQWVCPRESGGLFHITCSGQRTILEFGVDEAGIL